MPQSHQNQQLKSAKTLKLHPKVNIVLLRVETQNGAGVGTSGRRAGNLTGPYLGCLHTHVHQFHCKQRQSPCGVQLLSHSIDTKPNDLHSNISFSYHFPTLDFDQSVSNPFGINLSIEKILPITQANDKASDKGWFYLFIYYFLCRLMAP